uniref:Uncharacterized protein n=1 Tax=Rhizophora mucronata TaxID=61149 RepID=A0A2P2L9T8_RHIMU
MRSLRSLNSPPSPALSLLLSN